MIKIAITGTRGIPARHGGFETFAEELSHRLAAAGYSVAVQCDNLKSGTGSLNGVVLYYSPVTKSSKPLRYYFNGILWGLRNADIVLVAGTGGSLFYFLNVFYRKIIITNTDGIEFRRLKWPPVKRWYVKLSEIIAVRTSDHLIADSRAVFNYLTENYPSAASKTSIAEYGAELNEKFDPSVLEKHKIEPWKYYLTVSRIEPENNVSMIIDGFLMSGTEHPLIIVGPLSDSSYCRSIAGSYNSERVRFTGGIYDRGELNSLRAACKAYIHGHSVGGTNPSLLEAMGNGNIAICHDNVFNREVTAGSQLYFKDTHELAVLLERVERLSPDQDDGYRNKSRERIRTYYNWDNILLKYSAIFNKFHSGKA